MTKISSANAVNPISAVDSDTINSTSARPWAQFWGVVRYENLLQWRQRGWLVGTVPILVLCILLLLDLRNTVASAAALGYDVERGTSQVLLGLQPMLHIVSLLLYPIMLSDTLPKDRQWMARELFASLPVGQGTLLAGKLAASALSVTLSMGGIVIVTGVLAYVLVEPYDPLPFLAMGLVRALVVAVLSTSLSVLFAAGQPTRRRAVYFGVGFGTLSLVFLAVGLGTSIPWGDFFNPSLALIMRHYLQQMISASNSAMTALFGVPIEAGRIILALVIVAGEVVLGWLIARRWLQKEF